MRCSRRSFFAAALAAAAAPPRPKPTLCIFSKHLPKLNCEQLGKAAREIGFAGVDLTVRPGGHVLPGSVAQDLPRAVQAIRDAGIAVPMITTALTSASDPAARPTLSAAGRLNIPFFKPGYWRYKPGVPVDQAIAQVKREAAGLIAIGQECKIAAGLHNHSGDYVGAAVWDTRDILAGLDPAWAGYYFDPCHATVEGGSFGWQLSARIALANLKMVALKDFYWAKTGGKWKINYCPLGEGMVDWTKFFGMLAAAGFAGPVTLHLEYDPPDEPAAIARDFEFMRTQVDQAYR